MTDILPSRHLDSLEALALQFLPSLEAVEAVPSIQNWCRRHDVPEANPFRVGKCLHNDRTNQFRILLSEPISQDMKNSVITAIRARGFSEDALILSDDMLFLHHLILHEVAHALYDSYEEQDCDKWAFDRLKELQSNHALKRDAQTARAP